MTLKSYMVCMDKDLHDKAIKLLESIGIKKGLSPLLNNLLEDWINQKEAKK